MTAETTKYTKHTKFLHCSMISSFFNAFPFVYFVYFVEKKPFSKNLLPSSFADFRLDTLLSFRIIDVSQPLLSNIEISCLDRLLGE